MADVNDLNQDGRVTRDEVDQIAGKKPGLGGGISGVLKTVVFPGYRAAQAKGGGQDWEVRRNTLYQKYGITPGSGQPKVPGQQVAQGMSGMARGAQAGAAAQQGMPGAFGAPLQPTNKTPFPTLGVNQGLIDMGLVREQMDPTGAIVYATPRKGGESVVMQYKAQDAYETLAAMDDEQLGNFRRAMYISGYGDPKTMAGPLAKDDLDLMVQAMTDANFSGDSWDAVVNKRVEAGGRYARPLTMYEAAIESGDITSVLKQYGQRNGIVLSDSFIANQSRAVKDGQIETEDLLNLIKETYVKTLYPAFSKEIDMGLTIEDLAGPWRSHLAETFGVPEDQISLFDPLMQAALQNFGPDGTASKTSMNQFAQMVQDDPRWEYSPDAWNKVGLASQQLAAEFGMNNQYQAPTTPSMSAPPASATPSAATRISAKFGGYRG